MAKQAEYVGRAGTYNVGKLRFTKEVAVIVSDDAAAKLKEKRDSRGRRLFVISAVDEDAVGTEEGDAVHAAREVPEFPARGFESKDAALAFCKTHFPELLEGDKPLTKAMALRTLNEILVAAWARTFNVDAVEVGGGGDEDDGFKLGGENPPAPSPELADGGGLDAGTPV